LNTYTLRIESNASTYTSIGIFAARKIMAGEELTIDYQWDNNELDIDEDVPCLCGSSVCRKILKRSNNKNKKYKII